jgi:hypothetical protein
MLLLATAAALGPACHRRITRALVFRRIAGTARTNDHFGERALFALEGIPAVSGESSTASLRLPGTHRSQRFTTPVGLMSADAIGAHGRHFVWSIKPGACLIANGFAIFGINDGQFGLPKPTDDRRNRELVINGAQLWTLHRLFLVTGEKDSWG